jgi:hypothetical protein
MAYRGSRAALRARSPTVVPTSVAVDLVTSVNWGAGIGSDSEGRVRAPVHALAPGAASDNRSFYP